MRSQITALVEETRQKLSEIHGIEIKKLSIEFGLKGKTAGRCWPNRKYEFNLYIAENNDGYLERTVPHEVAHQASIQIYGVRGRGHGRGWKNIMHSLGLESSRCHSYKNLKAARKTKNYHYSCTNCVAEFILSSVRYNKAMRGITSYICPKCGTKINMSLAKLIVDK